MRTSAMSSIGCGPHNPYFDSDLLLLARRLNFLLYLVKIMLVCI